MRILGEMVGVQIEDRGENDLHQLITIMDEDDGNWFRKMTLSSYWLDDAIRTLKQTKKYLESNHFEKDRDGGYRRKTGTDKTTK